MNLNLKFDKYGYYPLHASLLDICDKQSLSNLEDSDEFTSKYTLEEILESAKRSNMVFPASENIKLIITYLENSKIREYKAYTKDDNEFLEFDVLEFFKDNISNKNIINQLKNSFECKNYLPEDLIDFVMTINNASIIQILHNYTCLSYYSRRTLKEYIFEKIVPKLENKGLQRKR